MDNGIMVGIGIVVFIYAVIKSQDARYDYRR